VVQFSAQQSRREEKEIEAVTPVRLLRQHLQMLSAAGLSHLPRATLPQTPAEVPTPNSALDAPAVPMRVPAAARAEEFVGTSLPDSSRATTAATMDLHKIEAPNLPLTLEPGRSQSTGAAPLAVPPGTLAQRQSALAILAEKVKGCTRCSELAGTRTQTVFGVGNPQARILFIGEAPGADEDKQGEPFVGKAGQLLNQIIAASRLKREEIYICNVLKCRPPGNRTPLEDECNNCREYLLGQLTTIDPEYIVCWGAVAAQNLLKTTLTIGKLRCRFLQFGRAKVLCTYHPSYLLRNAAAKKDVWRDMQFLMADMGVDLTARS
jgi:DNA polymerase